MSQITEYTEVRCEYDGPDPGKPEPGIMQVFYEDGIPAMVDFLCPCGCGFTCPTQLVKPGEAPRERYWQYSPGPPGPTLRPSFCWLGNCLSHFTITDGKVQIEP